MKDYLINNATLLELPEFLDELPLWSAPFGLKLLEFIEYKHGINAIDIGFGTGFPLMELAMRLGNSSVVYGIDPWKEAIHRANSKMAYYGTTNIKIIEGFAESIPLQNGSVDLITSNNGLNNVEDIDKVLSECARIAKPGAQFVQTLNLDDTMFEFYGQFTEVLSYMHLYNEIEQMHQHIYQKRRPIDELVSLIRKNGFIIKDLEHNQFNYRFTDGTAFLNHPFIRLAFMDAWRNLLPEGKQELIFDAIESRMNEQARLLGGLKLSIPFVLINAIRI
jgi:ubiquinone/menaquinone biosynthesis C-methylase UbiE